MFSIKKLLKSVMICLSAIYIAGNMAWAEDTTTKPQTTPAETKAPDVHYTGIYKDRQLIPNIMAIHCKMNAEDVVKDISKLDTCIRQYINEMNNEDSGVAQEGRKDFNTMRLSVINDMLSTSITKSASIKGYEETLNKYAEANTNTDTEFDTETALSNTIAFSTDIKNSLRELFIEVLKYEVISGMGVMTPDFFEDTEEEAAAKEDKNTKGDTPSATPNSQTTGTGTGNKK